MKVKINGFLAFILWYGVIASLVYFSTISLSGCSAYNSLSLEEKEIYHQMNPDLEEKYKIEFIKGLR